MTTAKKSQSTAEAMPPSRIEFRSAYSPRLRVALSFPAQGRTKQSFKAECDINTIMARYLKTGMIDFVNKHAPQYHDVTGLDYQEALLVVAQSQTLFNELPSHIRLEFDNNPAEFLDFVNDPANAPEMAAMGLLTPEAARRYAPAPAAPSTPPVVAPEAIPDASAPPPAKA